MQKGDGKENFNKGPGKGGEKGDDKGGYSENKGAYSDNKGKGGYESYDNKGKGYENYRIVLPCIVS